MLSRRRQSRVRPFVCALACAATLAACSTVPSPGPSRIAVIDQGTRENAPYLLVPISDFAIEHLAKFPGPSLYGRFGDYRPALEQVVGVGDTLGRDDLRGGRRRPVLAADLVGPVDRLALGRTAAADRPAGRLDHGALRWTRQRRRPHHAADREGDRREADRQGDRAADRRDARQEHLDERLRDGRGRAGRARAAVGARRPSARRDRRCRRHQGAGLPKLHRPHARQQDGARALSVADSTRRRRTSSRGRATRSPW